MAAPKVCRVCLVSDRAMYRVANTELEKTYEQVSKEKLHQVGRPVTLCFICVSQLRRCGKFARAAQDANEALDQWYKNRTDNLNLTERPLLSLIKTHSEVVDFISNGIQDVEVKQEITDKTNDIITSGNEGTAQTEENLNCIFVRDYNCENDSTCISDKVNDNTQLNNQIEFDTFGKTLIDVSDIKHMSEDENDNTQLSESIDIKYEIIQLEDCGPSTSNMGYDESNYGSDDENVPKQKKRYKAKSSKATKVKMALTGAERARRYRQKLKQNRTMKDLSEEDRINRRKKWRESKKTKQTTTSAEKAKRYREKLKQNREKLEEKRIKNLMRIKNSQKKIHEMTEEEKEIKRKQWRDAKEQQRIKKKKQQEIKIKHRTTGAEKARRYREKLKQNPERYEYYKKKQLMRVKNLQRSIKDLSEEEKISRRKKSRESKNKQIQKEEKTKQTSTSAEKAKRYREKLKQNLEKFEEMRIKNLMRIKNSRKKIHEMTEEEKEIKRKQWRDAKEQQRIKKKQQEIKIKHKSTSAERARRYREKLKKQNPEKYEEMRMKNLIRMKKYYRKKVNDLTEEGKEMERT